MGGPLFRFPSAEKAWQRYLQERLTMKVGTRTRQDPVFVKVLRAGGNAASSRGITILDSPQMIFECYHTDDDKAAEFAATVRAIVHAAEGSEIAPGVYFKRLRDVSGPSNIPDEEHNSSRYSFTVMTDLRAQVVPEAADLEGTKNNG